MSRSEESEGHDPLLQQLRQGDAIAFAHYLDRECPRLEKYVATRLGAGLRGKMEPADVVQDVCLDAVRAFPEMDFSGQAPFGWLCQLVERKIIDAHRRFNSQKRGANEVPLQGGAAGGGQDDLIQLLVASITSPSQAFSRNRQESRMLGALAELTPEQQLAMKLRYVQGLSSREVALQLGKSDGATRVILSRTLNQLRGLLGVDSSQP